MSLRVIKYVAGGGKTRNSIDYIKNNKNGIYLAFNNKVVNEISNRGFLSKTIDSFFVSYIIPKLTHLIPIIKDGANITYLSTDSLSPNLKGIANIRIDENGYICNHSSRTGINMEISNDELFRMSFQPNLNFIKTIFGRKDVKLTDSLRSSFCHYIIKKYPDQIIKIVKQRFAYVIIDEAQDLKDYREEFADLLSKSDINLIVLGDDYQNINGGGNWFYNLTPSEKKTYSYRCPECNCKWIRDKLGIDINGNDDKGGVNKISIDNAISYDNRIRTLLYDSKRGQVKNIVENWKGPTLTIKTAKGQTIEEDVVIVGKTLNLNNMYTAITRSKKCVYLTAILRQ